MSDDDLLRVLHAVRLVGFGTDEPVSARAELSLERTRPLLRLAASEGWVTYRDGRMTGWSLTAEGRRRGEALLHAEVAHHDVHAAIRNAYDEFLLLNGPFLALCTSWQLKTLAPGRFVPNHHDDPEYDAAVVGRLVETHHAIGPVVDGLAGSLDRFGRYRARLTLAVERVTHGDLDWFTRPVIDSYHTVWFELHEDLLATLGLERTAEH